MAHKAKPTSRDETTMNPRKPLTSNHRPNAKSRQGHAKKRIASAKKPHRRHQRRRASKERGFKGYWANVNGKLTNQQKWEPGSLLCRLRYGHAMRG